MNLKVQTPQQALKAYIKQQPKKGEIDLFKSNLIKLLDKIEIVK